MFNAVGIVGLGLIGGSLGLRIKHDNLAKMVIGYDNSGYNLNDALSLEIIDISANSLKSFNMCDFVIVSVPPKAVVETIIELTKILKEDTLSLIHI